MSDLFFAFPKTGENCKHKTVGFLEAFSGAGIISFKQCILLLLPRSYQLVCGLLL